MKRYNVSLIILLLMLTNDFFGQATGQWDSIKTAVSPAVAPSFSDEYETPYRQPLSGYGWEDGVHVSRDGLHLYALYYPGDLLGFTSFFQNHISDLEGCDLLGNPDYIRSYAETYGMDMNTNPLNCDTFINVDILHASRTSAGTQFTEWHLSDIARPATLESGPMPLFNPEEPAQVDIFMFTGNADIWMIKNTTANPSGVEQAIRLDPPINPENDEFTADNPHLERLNEDTLLLVYEKYTNPDTREFLYAFSDDEGDTWSDPVAMTTISPSSGKIEHPHLYRNPNGEWYMYFSVDCDIYRSKQGTEGNWDDWEYRELVISKGNASCVGEPSLTTSGNISFAVVYQNEENGDSTDTYDIDPWYLPKKDIVSSTHSKEKDLNATVFPNPFHDRFQITSSDDIDIVMIYDLFGRKVYENHNYEKDNEINLNHLSSGVYIVEIWSAQTRKKYKITKR